MEFSCHTWGFNDMLLTQALGNIARMGFRYVDLGVGPHLNLARAIDGKTGKGIRESILTDLKAFNLKLADLYLLLPRISVDDDIKRDADLKQFEAVMGFAREIGTPGITVTPGLLHPAGDKDAVARTVGSLRRMADATREAGIALSIEPHLDSMAHTPEQALQLVQQVDGLQLTLDWAHLVCQGFGADEIARLLPHVRHVQIRQAKKDALQTKFADGTIDIAQVMTMLHEADYTGLICVEYMQTIGWHGIEEVASIEEALLMRDALREARDALLRA